MSRNLRVILFCSAPVIVLLFLGFCWGGLLGVGIVALFLTIFFLYLFFRCDEIVRRAHGATEIDGRDSLGVVEVVNRLAYKFSAPVPRVYLVADEAPFIFSVGKNSYESSIVVSSSILGLLSYEELESVLAHQIVRIRDSGVFVDSFLAAAMLTMLRPFPGLGKRGAQASVFLLAPIVMSIAKALQGDVSTFTIDRKAAKSTRRAGSLAGALRKVDNLLHHATNPRTLPLRLAAGHLYIVSPVVEHPWISWFMGVRTTTRRRTKRLSSLSLAGTSRAASSVNRRIHRLLQY